MLKQINRIFYVVTFAEIPKSKFDDQSFSRAWSKSETTDKALTGPATQSSFERQNTKYKSDGNIS